MERSRRENIDASTLTHTATLQPTRTLTYSDADEVEDPFWACGDTALLTAISHMA